MPTKIELIIDNQDDNAAFDAQWPGILRSSPAPSRGCSGWSPARSGRRRTARRPRQHRTLQLYFAGYDAALRRRRCGPRPARSSAPSSPPRATRSSRSSPTSRRADAASPARDLRAPPGPRIDHDRRAVPRRLLVEVDPARRHVPGGVRRLRASGPPERLCIPRDATGGRDLQGRRAGIISSQLSRSPPRCTNVAGNSTTASGGASATLGSTASVASSCTCSASRRDPPGPSGRSTEVPHRFQVVRVLVVPAGRLPPLRVPDRATWW